MLNAAEINFIWETPAHERQSKTEKQKDVLKTLKNPMSYQDIKRALPHIRPGTISVVLRDLKKKNLIHCTEGKNCIYGLIDQALPNPEKTYIEGKALEILKLLSVRPLKKLALRQLTGINPRELGNILYRLRGKVRGYDKKITLTETGYYCIKNEYKVET